METPRSYVAEIAPLLDAISELADQMQLIALNTAIAATEAGDGGTGAAKVAGSVEELARQIASATNALRRASGAAAAAGEADAIAERLEAFIRTTRAAPAVPAPGRPDQP